MSPQARSTVHTQYSEAGGRQARQTACVQWKLWEAAEWTAAASDGEPKPRSITGLGEADFSIEADFFNFFFNTPQHH